MSETDVLEKPLTDNSDSDEKEYAHYAESTSVTEGYILGTPVMTVCGVVFIPSKNPERLEICPVCKKIVEALLL